MFSRLAIALVTVGLFIHQPCPAQAPRERVDTEVINKIREEGLKKSKAMETISYLTDVHGPRLTGSPQIRTAAEWTKGRLTEWGLENVHLETRGAVRSRVEPRGIHLQHCSAELRAAYCVP